MVFFKRIFLFLLTNILIVTTISIVLNLLGVGHYVTAYGLDYGSLAVFCFVWGMGGAFISLMLSKVMAKWMMGVKVIDPHQAQGAEAELVSIVHNLARSASLPAMPEVGIYEGEEVNAFATGPSKGNSLVAVSTGLLRRMNKEQIEGVLGHEISHVANGDMVTMTLIQGVVNAFVMFLARVIGFVASQNVKEENSRTVRWVVTIVLDIFLSILASMVVAWFSRQREFRADAGGASLAGKDKMVSALKALGGTLDVIDNSQPSLATMKISGRPSGFFALFSTHPSLEERIARLENR